MDSRSSHYRETTGENRCPLQQGDTETRAWRDWANHIQTCPQMHQWIIYSPALGSEEEGKKEGPTPSPALPKEWKLLF